MHKSQISKWVLVSQVIVLFIWSCNDDASHTPKITSDDIQNPDAGATMDQSNGGSLGTAGSGDIQNPNAGATMDQSNGGSLGTAGNGVIEDNGDRSDVAGGIGPSSGVGMSLPEVDGGSGSNTGDSGGGGTSAEDNDGQTAGSGGTITSPGEDDVPDPVTTPFVWGVGLGITDVPAAIQYFTGVMKMTVEKEVTREDRDEVVLYATQAQRGSRVVLMKYHDGRNTQKITAKLVFYSLNVAGTVAEANFAGYGTIINMGVVAQVTGPDTYTHEILSVIGGTDASISVPYLIAIGFSVSNLSASIGFYAGAFDMIQTTPYSGMVTDATGASFINEQTMEYATAGGAGLVLQYWSSVRNSKDNPIKIVTFVPDAQMYADRVIAAGGSIVEEAKRTAVYDNRLLIVAKDIDGYTIELVQ